MVSAPVGLATQRPLRSDAVRNRKRVIEAARAVFAERGSEASMEEIARSADVGVGTLYRHFPRRIDLVEAVYREEVDLLVAEGQARLTDDDPWAAFAAWLLAFVRYAKAKRTFLTELHEAFEKCPDLAVSSREKIRGATGTLLRRAQAAGLARPEVTGADVMQLVGGLCMAGDSTLEQNERLLTYVLDGIRTPRQG